MSESDSHEQSDVISKNPNPEELDSEKPKNPVLARLIEEVRNEGAKGETAYDRVHNRHNR